MPTKSLCLGVSRVEHLYIWQQYITKWSRLVNVIWQKQLEFWIFTSDHLHIVNYKYTLLERNIHCIRGGGVSSKFR